MRPIEATSGSQYVQPGTWSRLTGTVGWPAIVSAATMPSADATCASQIVGVTSPIAQTPGTFVRWFRSTFT